jgi:hypothetical protein
MPLLVGQAEGVGVPAGRREGRKKLTRKVEEALLRLQAGITAGTVGETAQSIPLKVAPVTQLITEGTEFVDVTTSDEFAMVIGVPDTVTLYDKTCPGVIAKETAVPSVNVIGVGVVM